MSANVVSKVRGMSHTLLVSYLLGVNEHLLSKNLTSEYIKSGSLIKISGYEDCEIVRALSVIRQFMLINYKKVMHEPTMLDAFPSCILQDSFHEELKVLKMYGINLNGAYRVGFSRVDVLNIINTEIDKRLDGIFKHYKVELGKYYKVFFNLPRFDRKSILQYIEAIKGKNFPNSIIINGYKKLENKLPYVLLNDTNLYASALVVSDEIYDNSYTPPQINWELIDERGCLSSDYTETKPLNIENDDDETPNTRIENDVRPNTGVFYYTDELKCMRDLSNLAFDDRTMHDCDSSLYSYITDINFFRLKKRVVFVDCDNIEFFQFISLLIILEKLGIYAEFRLFADFKASFLWGLAPKLFKTKHTITVKHIDRIKDSKSVVDMVMAVEMTKEILEGNPYIGLWSSDSDFYGVVDLFTNTDFLIIHDSNATHKGYLRYLDNNKHDLIDSSSMEYESIHLSIVTTLMTHIYLNVVAKTPPNMWTSESMITNLSYELEKETKLPVSLDVVKALFDDLKTNLVISIEGNNTHLSCKGITLTV